MYHKSGVPAAPSGLVSLASSCDSVTGNQVTIQWTPPTYTGGVDIEGYLVNVTGPAGYTCPPDQCNVTTTSTTLTGLQCNTTYQISVRAVTCIGVGDASDTINISVNLDDVNKLVTDPNSLLIFVQWNVGQNEL